MSMKSHDYQANYFTDPFDNATKIVFLNTCGFISSAREEANETVKQLLKAKKTVYLMGCAVQYYKQMNPPSFPPLAKEDFSKHSLFAKEGGGDSVHYLSRSDMNKVGIKELIK